MKRVVLFRSTRRFDAFLAELERQSFNVTVLDFDEPEWVTFDYSNIFAVIYFPAFYFSSNHPLALYQVQDNLKHLHARYPHLHMFPDAGIIDYYSDKYRQWLFLESSGLPHPDTLALTSESCLDRAEQALGYPMVVKNRFGAGGDYVFKVDNRKQLAHYFRLSQLDLRGWREILFYLRMFSKRTFLWSLLRNRRMQYPFVSAPLLAQRFIVHDRDLKTVVGNGRVVEAHWRIRAESNMWKMNIDGGGIGEWSAVPEEALEVSRALARELQASWINIDLIHDGARFLISEFSPVWHHYGYREQPSFVYKDDYNIDIPLEISLNLERIVVDSLCVQSNSD